MLLSVNVARATWSTRESWCARSGRDALGIHVGLAGGTSTVNWWPDACLSVDGNLPGLSIFLSHAPPRCWAVGVDVLIEDYRSGDVFFQKQAFRERCASEAGTHLKGRRVCRQEQPGSEAHASAPRLQVA